jgi:hypothetical protein
MPNRSLSVFAAAGALAAALTTLPAGAVGTRHFALSSMDELKGGDLTGVSIDSTGSVRAGLTFGTLAISDAQTAWSSLQLADGVLVGTGSEGKVFKVAGGQAKLVAKTGQMAVTSLVSAWKGQALAGTFPEGKIYTIEPNGTGGDAKVFATLTGAEDVWDMAFDAKNNALYAVTGPEGKLFRIDQAGKAQVYFDSEEAHLVSVAVAADGSVYAGSSGSALLYKITGPGRATVVHDFDGDEVRDLAIAPSGSLFVVQNAISEPFVMQRRNRSQPMPSGPVRPRPGRGSLYRVTADANPERLLYESDTHFTSVAIADDGSAYVGAGAEGRIYTVNDNLVSRIVADAEERQVASLVMAGTKRYFVTSDPVAYHEVKGQGGPDAVWTSKVLDAGLRAQWGRLTWRAEGTLELETRSGSTATPDATWSPWAGALLAPGDTKSPAARFVQIRARWSRDANAILRDVDLAFLTDNARAVVTQIEGSSKLNRSGLRTGLAASGGEVGRPSTSLSLSWRVENPDQDELRYRLSYKLDGSATWHALTKPTEKLTRTSWDWDTGALPEGVYRVKVEASDELANPADKVLRHELESGAILVDNTPPSFKSLAIAGRKLTGEVTDGLGPIARIEVAVAGSDEWRPIFPKDAVFDEATEDFDADVSSAVPAGSQVVAVRVFDTAGNSATRNVNAQ